MLWRAVSKSRNKGNSGALLLTALLEQRRSLVPIILYFLVCICALCLLQHAPFYIRGHTRSCTVAGVTLTCRSVWHLSATASHFSLHIGFVLLSYLFFAYFRMKGNVWKIVKIFHFYSRQIKLITVTYLTLQLLKLTLCFLLFTRFRNST